ncbi:MAG: MFS transporter [Gemmataceae bacterium]|nr:MFS transporter [Gemmataceae bacterium]MCI0737490.1 MFS transporter [Gemmataceae bacterium]
MSYSTAPASSPSFSDKMLFWASFFTLIAAGIGFSVRGAILVDWGQQFGFTQSELGTITGGGLFLFGVSIIFWSFLADWIGYGKLMLVAFLLHTSSAVVTFAATPVFEAYGKDSTFWCLNIGMYLFALGNGTCEAVINPLTATLFPRNRTHWLNILHAGWPGGLILGALIVLGFNQVAGGVRWEYKLGVFMIPVLLYGLMMVGRHFPRSEASLSGVDIGTMVVTLFAPILLFLFLLHAMVGYVELGTDSWITNITETVLANQNLALLAFIWTNLLMFGLRFFAGPIVHQINPVGLLFVSAVIATVGLWMLGQPFTGTTWAWVGAVTVYGIGKTFYWPTLLGTISERFPKGGALALGISGGVGMLSAGLLGSPGIGYKQDYFAVQSLSSSAPSTYERYLSRDESGKPNPTGFPLVSDLMPEKVPPVAGLDNSKLKVFDDYGKVLADQKEGKSSKTTLESDLDTLHKVKAAGGKVEPKLEQNLTSLMNWWQKDGQPNYDTDKPKLGEARLYGGKEALLYTAAVPAAMAVGFLLLILFFAATGGYKQVHIGDKH